MLPDCGIHGISALDASGNPASFSSHGYWVDIAAPGVDVLSLLPGERREIRGSFPAHALAGAADQPVFSYQGVHVRSEGTR